jgi:uncharacterized protein (TIGR03083 family)
LTLERLWLLATARSEREAMGRTIQYTPPEAWEEENLCAGWRNRDIVSHLAASEVAAAAALGGEAAAEVEEFAKTREGARFDLDEFNDWSVERRAGQPFRAIVREWGSAADLFLSRAAKVSVEEWTTRKVTWTVGQIGASYLIQSRVMEWYLHGEDLLAGGGNPPRLEHNPIYCVNDLAIRSIPYALALAGLSYPGRSIQFELDAVGGGSWHWGLAPRETPPPGKRPDALIEGRAHAFCMVTARRVPAEYFLAQGTLQTAGDLDLAETVLRHIRAFA